MFGADCEDVPSANATPLAIPSDKAPASATLAPVDNSFPEAIVFTQPFVIYALGCISKHDNIKR